MSEKKLYEEADHVPWTPRQTVIGALFTLIPWIVFALGLTLFKTDTARSTPLPPGVDLTSAIITFFFASLVEGAFLITPFYFANRAFRSLPTRGRLALDALGLRSFNVGVALSWVVLFFFAIFALNALYQAVITAFHLNLQTNDQVILQQSKTAPLTTYATLIVSVVVAPFCEEIFFRGFLFAGLLRTMQPGWAMILSALVFAVAHADPGSFAILFFIGVALAFLRWRTRSLWPGILLHMLNNGVGTLLIVLVMQGVMKA